MNYFLVFCSGFTFAIGGINFIIGLSGKQVKVYLYFGILSLAACFFLMAQIEPLYSAADPSLSNTLSIITACTFYYFILRFVSEFSCYKNKAFQIVISVIILFLGVTYFFLDTFHIFNVTWNILAHTTILSIGIYGIISAFKGQNKITTIWLYIYLFLMFLLSLLAILVGVGSVFNIQILPDPEGFISPLDFFPIIFSVIIGYKMSEDIIRSYRLESEVKAKEYQWSKLMETINLVIIQLNTQGQIVWVNKCFEELTGYSENDVLGKDWFDKMLVPSEKELVRDNFQKFISGQQLPTYQNLVRIKTGELKTILWSNISIQNNQRQIVGGLSIGTDVTDREISLAEIKNLKDQLEKENLQLREEYDIKNLSQEIIGQSDSLKYVMKRAEQVASTNSTVLLEGETGVGKELFANLIHQSSQRRFKPFIKVNCASLPRDLIESELFGHEKGAFTGALKSRQGRFELADKGTIFLDEIGELPGELQPKLLRVLQTGDFERIGSEKTRKVDVRVITATNRNLQEEVKLGNFREDLFYRLNVYPITIPPLRQHKEDIQILVKHFTNKIGGRMGKLIKDISRSDIRALQEYDWPGNIRELENLVERSIINSNNGTLKIDRSQLNTYSNNLHSETTMKHQVDSLKTTEKNYILRILEQTSWKINGNNGAAEKLGMAPSTLRSKMKKLRIERP